MTSIESPSDENVFLVADGEKEETSEKEQQAKAQTEKGKVQEKEPLLSDKDDHSPTAPETDIGSTSHAGIDVSSMHAKKKEMKLDLPSIVKQKQQQQVQVDIERLNIQKQPSGPLRIAVFIKKDRKSGERGSYVMELAEKGKSSTAADIKDKMIEYLSIPKTSAHMFAIWFISPYLELQLKCHHVPFYLRKQWPDLLKKLSDCPEDERELDEPVLVFQRNSFITIALEEEETEHNVLKRLFEEASYNILKARYPIPPRDAEILGGILMRCYEGEFNAEEHKPGFFKKRLNEFLPYYAIGSNKISQYIYSSGAEQRVLRQYEFQSRTLGDKLSCYNKFLQECRKLEFYGCVFFKGYCYQEGTDYKLWKREQQLITVGLNRDGITLFKGETEEVLSHFKYHEISWDYKHDGDEDGVPKEERFIIEYDEGGEARQIQIFSNHACLMDAMVQSCMSFISEEQQNTSSENVIRKKLHAISYKSDSARPAEA